MLNKDTVCFDMLFLNFWPLLGSVYGKTSQFYKALVSLDMSAINIFEHDAMSAHLPIISQPKQQNVCICIFIVS